MTKSVLRILLMVLTASMVGCGDDESGDGSSDATADVPLDTLADTPDMDSACSTEGTGFICNGQVAIECSMGSRVGESDCAASGEVCVGGRGCATCIPGERSCDGAEVMECRADGSGTDVSRTCAEGSMCSNGECATLCDQAEASNSYIGCEYWPTVTLNSLLDTTGLDFGVVVSNPQTIPAEITVTRGDEEVASQTVAAGAVETIPLPWVEELRRPLVNPLPPHSTIVRAGAYKLNSSAPVTVYQFNPIGYERDVPERPQCADGGGELGLGANECFSLSNDAALLLPTHALTGNYTVLTRPAIATNGGGRIPGYFAITAADEGPVEVQVRVSAALEEAPDSSVGALRAGETGSFTLMPGDVLQITSKLEDLSDCMRPGAAFCEATDSDLTGTVIRANGRVSVIAGHDCANVPFDVSTCDHLEEALFPEDAWDKVFVVTRPAPMNAEPHIVKILSGADGNQLRFSHPVNPDVTLDRGETLEFETDQDFRVSGTGALLVGQFMVGQQYDGTFSPDAVGDPSFSLAIPANQYRRSYSFLAPATFPENYVNINVEVGTGAYEVRLDGEPVTGFTRLGGTASQTARLPISPGAHTIEGDAPFGILVYGRGFQTSYMYPGGLDLAAINEPPPLE